MAGMIARVTESVLAPLNDNVIVRKLADDLGIVLRDRIAQAALFVLLGLFFIGIFGQVIAPYGHDEQHFEADGGLERVEPPSLKHPLGTTERGEDVLSRVLIGARPTLLVGLIGGSLIITIGGTIGITAGYVGGRAETLLMRLTDFVYGVPLIPFAIVLLTIFGIGFWTSIVVLASILWRGNARVLRSEVLKIKERPYIKAAKAIGASRRRIIIRHILPNVIGMVILFWALGIGIAIIYQASLAFLGVANPFVPSWGIMVRNVFTSGYIGMAWWWSLPPGILISVTVLSTYLLGRGYERLTQEDELLLDQ